jgi:hypothetical protein
VGCTSQGNCVVAGDYRSTTTSAVTPMVAVESAGSWGPASAVEVPANAVPIFGQLGDLTSLSCTSVGDCVAAGWYSDSSEDEQQAMTVVETDGTWGQALEFDGLPANAMTGEVNWRLSERGAQRGGLHERQRMHRCRYLQGWQHRL